MIPLHKTNWLFLGLISYFNSKEIEQNDYITVSVPQKSFYYTDQNGTKIAVTQRNYQQLVVTQIDQVLDEINKDLVKNKQNPLPTQGNILTKNFFPIFSTISVISERCKCVIIAMLCA